VQFLKLIAHGFFLWYNVNTWWNWAAGDDWT